MLWFSFILGLNFTFLRLKLRSGGPFLPFLFWRRGEKRRLIYRVWKVLSGSEIWLKYGAGFGKTQNVLTGNRIWLLPGKRDFYQNLGTGCGISFRMSVGNSKTDRQGFSVVSRGWGGGTAIYGLYRYVWLWRVWFSSSLPWDRVYNIGWRF